MLQNQPRLSDCRLQVAVEVTQRTAAEPKTESAKDGKSLGKMTLEEMDEYWERAKVM